MSILQAETDRLHNAVLHPQNAGRRAELYAAQQALCWAQSNAGFKKPYDMIMGIGAEREDCLVEPCPVRSLDIHDPERF
jgi:hypothetical protein